jgi:hypothetical protein
LFLSFCLSLLDCVFSVHPKVHAISRLCPFMGFWWAGSWYARGWETLSFGLVLDVYGPCYFWACQSGFGIAFFWA